MTDDLDTRSTRLLKLLLGGPAIWERSGSDIVRIVTDDGVKRTRAAADVVAALGAAGRIEADAQGMQLTPAGHAAALRLAGEAGSGHPARQGRQPPNPAIDVPSAAPLVNWGESPLLWLHRRKGPDGKTLVDEVEFTAGERLRQDFTRAGLMPTVTSNWRDLAQGPSGGRGGPGDLADAAIAARRRVSLALDAVGPEFSGIVLDVCCFLKGLETVEAERHWPHRSAKVVLKLALQALARHYGIASTATGRDRSGGVRHWGADGYRPRIHDAP